MDRGDCSTRPETLVTQSTASLAVDLPSSRQTETTLGILAALSVSHLLNDTIQALLPAMFPVLKDAYHLSYTQISMITFTFQVASSLLQPLVGTYTDRRPQPFSLAAGMGFTLVGLMLLAQSSTLPMILISAALVGAGSAVFHPEASKLAMLTSGGRHGFAQSLFQVGGNFGTSLSPLLAAFIIVPYGQSAVVWFSFVALLAMVILYRVGVWYQAHLHESRRSGRHLLPPRQLMLPRSQVTLAIAVLVMLMISKFFYLISLTNYYTFYLKDKFHVSNQTSLLCLFVFQFAVAFGTIAGGLVGDRFGRKLVIWLSILGVAPFTLLMPYANFPMTILLSAIIGMLMASAFPAILVFAQELLPGRPGMVAGLFFGFAFGMSGVAALALGKLADWIGMEEVFRLCAFLPLIGLLTVFLPKLPSPAKFAAKST